MCVIKVYFINMINVVLLFCIFGYIATEDFLINNEKCKMPKFSAFTEETRAIYESLPYVNCTDLDILTYTTVKNNTAYLHINSDSIDQYYAPRDSIDCCYSYVKRKGTGIYPDNDVRISNCQPFNTTVLLKKDIVWVKCYLDADKIYENVHTTITINKSVKDKINEFNTRKDSKKKPLSVLFLVIDSVGRLNFERTMPLTRDYIIKNNFTEFIGYSKIDDNTFPNFNALLTGLNLKQSNDICKPEIVGQLDKCPMIWYDFKNYGYVTAYAEDWADISTYNYLKKGFKNPPTDYYYKPYMEAAQLVSTKNVDTMPFCAGPESQGERILNIVKEFVKTFKDHPTFGIFWMNTFSHNYVNSPSRMDEKFKIFMEGLKAEGVFDVSMVGLLADHGMRFGNVRRTVQGWYEERLPMNFISIPKWFQEQYPLKYESFKDNANKLTSTYDLYLTLQDVLATSVENYTMTRSKACATCASMFTKIPEKRSCLEAGIPERWCTCIGKFDRNHTGLTPEMTKAAVKFIADSNSLNTQGVGINKILSTDITHFQRKTYLRIIFEADDLYAYQAILRANMNPIRILKIVHIHIIH